MFLGSINFMMHGEMGKYTGELLAAKGCTYGEGTFIIPTGQNQYIQENIFNNAPIRRLALAMNTNTAFKGSKDSNPYHYQKFNLREIKIVRGNQVVVNIDTSDDIRAYVTTMRALKFEEDGPNIPFDNYMDHYVLVFDLTSTQESNVQMYYPDIVGAGLRLEMYFAENLRHTIEVIVLGERLSTVYIDKNGAVVKNGQLSVIEGYFCFRTFEVQIFGIFS